MSRNRAQLLLDVVLDLNKAMRNLDGLQVGDMEGKISPIKHRLMDATAPIIEEIRTLAAWEYAKGGDR